MFTPASVSADIRSGSAWLQGELEVPSQARGVILFAHGSGSGRQSPRNRYVASRLTAAHFATLLVDLLSPEETQEDERDGRYRFDISLLSHRLLSATDWLVAQAAVQDLPIGFFGASTAAA